MSTTGDKCACAGRPRPRGVRGAPAALQPAGPRHACSHATRTARDRLATRVPHLTKWAKGLIQGGKVGKTLDAKGAKGPQTHQETCPLRPKTPKWAGSYQGCCPFSKVGSNLDVVRGGSPRPRGLPPRPRGRTSRVRPVGIPGNSSYIRSLLNGRAGCAGAGQWPSGQPAVSLVQACGQRAVSVRYVSCTRGCLGSFLLEDHHPKEGPWTARPHTRRLGARPVPRPWGAGRAGTTRPPPKASSRARACVGETCPSAAGPRPWAMRAATGRGLRPTSGVQRHEVRPPVAPRGVVLVRRGAGGAPARQAALAPPAAALPWPSASGAGPLPAAAPDRAGPPRPRPLPTCARPESVPVARCDRATPASTPAAAPSRARRVPCPLLRRACAAP